MSSTSSAGTSGCSTSSTRLAPLAAEPQPGGQRPSPIANLTWTLAITDFRLRFYGSVARRAVDVIRPFAFFGVIYFVFTEIAGLDKDVKNYGVYILFAMVLFTFFAEVTISSVQSLVVRENLLRKMISSRSSSRCR